MTLNSILSIAIMFLLFMIVILAIIYFNMSKKEKDEITRVSPQKNEEKNPKEKIAKSYTKGSIFNFMEFDKIEDNMIIQKGGKKFLMAIECQGINYDLMSDIEKTSVESGFIQFLNTLREPIQIYIQTRTVNLEDSLKGYKEKLKKIESELSSKENKYKSMIESGRYNEKQLKNQEIEIKRQRNLFDYGRDIIFNTERMSMNKNVLRKKYYVILSYYYSNTENEELSPDEIRETAFSDLYTRCQSTIRTLGICGVNGRVLDSYELVDLLYNAYNRDEAENYGVERAERAGYDSLYVTSPDVLNKKMSAIDKTIQEKGLVMAEDAVKYANEYLQKEVEEKEESLDELIMQLANELVEENKDYLGEEVVNEAKKRIRKSSKTTKEKEVSKNGKKTTKKSIAS